MKKVYIDKTFFELDKLPDEFIFGLKKLSQNDFSLMTDEAVNINPVIKKILESESITFSQNSEDYDSLINNSSGFIGQVNEVIKQSRAIVYKRETKETKINIEMNVDGKGQSNISTKIGFFDHMLEQISKHGNIDLKINVDGDLHVDEHHTVEDTGIALGEALLKVLGDKKGIKRYGYLLPMDESIAQCAVDIGGRPYLNFNCEFKREYVGELPTELVKEFFKGFSMGLKCNLYLKAEGENDHHKIEAMFKAFAKSLNEACRIDERSKGQLPTTKGII
ncbi:MAG: imidazoleglycerol-phosphate dehydratase HisB [Ignavibacteria bacterium]|jgi:imidazoleglycerol-phosphate dehydratase/histidinol-phosphatase